MATVKLQSESCETIANISIVWCSCTVFQGQIVSTKENLPIGVFIFNLILADLPILC